MQKQVDHDGYQYADNPVNEEIIGQMGNTSLVRAYYDVKGGWGNTTKKIHNTYDNAIRQGYRY